MPIRLCQSHLERAHSPRVILTTVRLSLGEVDHGHHELHQVSYPKVLTGDRLVRRGRVGGDPSRELRIGRQQLSPKLQSERFAGPGASNVLTRQPLHLHLVARLHHDPAAGSP